MLPFTGLFEFQLAIAAFGTRVVRQARIGYAYRPSWPYFDAEARLERTAAFALDIDLSLRVRSASGTRCKLPQSPTLVWAPASQLLAPGILSARLHKTIRDRIDEAASTADRASRLQAGQPVPARPEQI